MKRLLTGMLAFIVAHACAQETTFGAKAGVNISNLHVQGSSNYDSKTGFYIGALAHIHASSRWALQPEAFYSLEGAHTRLIPNGTVYLHLHFVNVPLLLQYNFQNGLTAQGGMQMNFLVSARRKGKNIHDDIKDQFKSTSLSIPLGASYLFASGVGLDVRYVFGLSNLNRKASPIEQGNVFQAGVFYRFAHH